MRNLPQAQGRISRNCIDQAPSLTFDLLGEGLHDYRGAMLQLRLQNGFWPHPAA